mmetsp:Transcript_11325/g.35963  ORF Transcript_11325/g.35963 Transcript_11325/m.35963 type:complete len:353 (-) Transcript_11325:668-1726(-)
MTCCVIHNIFHAVETDYIGDLITIVSEGKTCGGFSQGQRGVLGAVASSVANILTCARALGDARVTNVALAAHQSESALLRLLCQEEADTGHAKAALPGFHAAIVPQSDRPAAAHRCAASRAISYALQPLALALGVPSSIEAIVVRGLDNPDNSTYYWSPFLSPARLEQAASVVDLLEAKVSASLESVRAASAAADAATRSSLAGDWKERSIEHLHRALEAVQADAVGEAVRALVQASYALGQRQLELTPRRGDQEDGVKAQQATQSLHSTVADDEAVEDVATTAEVVALPTSQLPPPGPLLLERDLPDPTPTSRLTSLDVSSDFAILPGLAELAAASPHGHGRAELVLQRIN